MGFVRFEDLKMSQFKDKNKCVYDVKMRPGHSDTEPLNYKAVFLFYAV